MRATARRPRARILSVAHGGGGVTCYRSVPGKPPGSVSEEVLLKRCCDFFRAVESVREYAFSRVDSLRPRARISRVPFGKGTVGLEKTRSPDSPPPTKLTKRTDILKRQVVTSRVVGIFSEPPREIDEKLKRFPLDRKSWKVKERKKDERVRKVVIARGGRMHDRSWFPCPDPYPRGS